jgi:hypothetical protein
VSGEREAFALEAHLVSPGGIDERHYVGRFFGAQSFCFLSPIAGIGQGGYAGGHLYDLGPTGQQVRFYLTDAPAGSLLTC